MCFFLCWGGGGVALDCKVAYFWPAQLGKPPTDSFFFETCPGVTWCTTDWASETTLLLTTISKLYEDQ